MENFKTLHIITEKSEFINFTDKDGTILKISGFETETGLFGVKIEIRENKYENGGKLD